MIRMVMHFMIYIKLNIEFAWFDLDYGGNPEGIFTAACPPEALHALENGIFLYVLKELFAKILNLKTCGHLDAHVYSWNNYPG